MNDKQVSDTWERGNPYEQYVGRWSRRVAPAFLSWLRVPAERARLRDQIRARIPAQTNGSIALIARAWAVRATVAK